MGDKSSIEWTEATWNPTTGCDRISRGCDHCYALTLAKRLKVMGNAKYQTDGDPRTSGPGFGVAVHQDTLALPLRWSPRLRRFAPRLPWPKNVWMGVSVEDDDHVRRVDDLRHVPAAVRFISAEPLLGPLPSWTSRAWTG